MDETRLRELLSQSETLTVELKLIEHSIPLDAISAQSAREKSIRHGHISIPHWLSE